MQKLAKATKKKILILSREGHSARHFLSFVRIRNFSISFKGKTAVPAHRGNGGKN